MRRVHYAWVVVAVIFACLLISAGVRATPGVLMVTIEGETGWTKATIGVPVAIGLVLYGLMGPFAAALFLSLGIRKTLVGALLLLSAGTALSSLATQPWHLTMTWGLLTGVGTGTVALVMAATIANRWFRARRGLAMGILTASTASGSLVFLPLLAALAEWDGWRTAVLLVAAAAALAIPFVLWLLPESPHAAGLRPYGATADEPPPAPPVVNPAVRAIGALLRGARHPGFWVLFISFFVCGLSTNGLVGTHLISYCVDQGIPPVRAAGLLAAMGVLDILGTTASGWLSDRYDNRKLLFWYYGLRGLSLVFLPFTDFSLIELTVFGLFYGLNWITTVPPTVRLSTEMFGEQEGPILFGWIGTGHQLGAATAAYGAAFLRTELDTYMPAFLISGGAAVLVGLLVLTLSASGRPKQAAVAG